MSAWLVVLALAWGTGAGIAGVWLDDPSRGIPMGLAAIAVAILSRSNP